MPSTSTATNATATHATATNAPHSNRLILNGSIPATMFMFIMFFRTTTRGTFHKFFKGFEKRHVYINLLLFPVNTYFLLISIISRLISFSSAPTAFAPTAFAPTAFAFNKAFNALICLFFSAFCSAK